MKLLLFTFIFIVFVIDTDKKVLVGDKVWTTKNLSVTKFKNGDAIYEAKTAEDWELAKKDKKAAFCYYNNDKLNEEKFGCLYNFYAVKDERGLAPEGWHIATDEEWSDLISFHGGKNLIAQDSLVKDPINLKPGGFRTYDGSFSSINQSVLFWTSTTSNPFLSFNRQFFAGNLNPITKGTSHMAMGMYVRCVKD